MFKLISPFVCQSRQIIRCRANISGFSRNSFEPNLFNSRFLNIRKLHVTPVHFESQLSILRRKTGYAFALCRKALDINEQDLAKAEKWLRAEATKQGWEKAERVKTRVTGEGLIGIHANSQKNQATMVEIKCETDFVAKNEIFINLVVQLAHKLSTQQFQLSDISENKDCINKLWIVDTNKLAEIGGAHITDAITKLGENIRFVRGCIMKINHSTNDTFLLPYTHAVSGKIHSNDKDVLLGKYGTIIAIQQSKSNPEFNKSADEEDETVYSKTIDDIGSRLGQHVIGLSPLTVTSATEDISNIDIDDVEPTALLKQKFLFNDEITVEEYLKNSNATVLDFIRFECGEEFTST